MIKNYLLLALATVLSHFAYTQSGTIDPTYADGAQQRLINFLPEEEFTTHSITDSQDRTWIAGQAFINGDWSLVIARLDADGNYDESFGGTGNAVIDLGNNNIEQVRGLALQDDDLIIAGVRVENGAMTPFLLSYTSGGFLNTDFGEFGVFVHDVEMSVTDITIDPMGSIFLSGVIQDNVAAVKVLPDGSGFDPGFGFFGATIADFPSTDESVAIDLDDEGNIYVFGYGELNGVTRGQITSFNSLGETNKDFTANGRRSITWPDDKQFFVSDGLLHSNEKIYLSGGTRDPNTGRLNTAAVAIDLAADQDMEFGQDGWMETDLAIGGDDFSNSMEEGLNGLYLATSIQEVPEGINSGILHIDEAGERVESFGSLGVVIVNVVQLNDDQGLSISFQSDNKILLVGAGKSDAAGIFGYISRLFNEAASGINDHIYLDDMRVYPNPASDFLSVSATIEGQGDLPYTIYNSQGNVVLQGILSSREQPLTISELPVGPYVLQVQGHRPEYWIKVD